MSIFKRLGLGLLLCTLFSLSLQAQTEQDKEQIAKNVQDYVQNHLRSFRGFEDAALHLPEAERAAYVKALRVLLNTTYGQAKEQGNDSQLQAVLDKIDMRHKQLSLTKDKAIYRVLYIFDKNIYAFPLVFVKTNGKWLLEVDSAYHHVGIYHKILSDYRNIK